jgi:hypothetical protein
MPEKSSSTNCTWSFGIGELFVSILSVGTHLRTDRESDYDTALDHRNLQSTFMRNQGFSFLPKSCFGICLVFFCFRWTFSSLIDWNSFDYCWDCTTFRDIHRNLQLLQHLEIQEVIILSSTWHLASEWKHNPYDRGKSAMMVLHGSRILPISQKVDIICRFEERPSTNTSRASITNRVCWIGKTWKESPLSWWCRRYRFAVWEKTEVRLREKKQSEDWRICLSWNDRAHFTTLDRRNTSPITFSSSELCLHWTLGQAQRW